MKQDVRIMDTREVNMINEDVVEQARMLAAMGRKVRAIARELGLARNTVKRYLGDAVAGQQARPKSRRLNDDEVEQARALYKTTAEGNAVVVHELLSRGDEVSLRTVQRAVAPVRSDLKKIGVATVRFETPPGQQLQIDFGERMVSIGGEMMRCYFFVARLSFSRRIFVRAGLSQRQDEWKLGLEGALQRFGGRPEVVVVDNAKALILEHSGDDVRVHPAFQSYCNDRGLAVYACKPYRARTKGKVESGVKYVKRNCIAGRCFEDMAALDRHLVAWMDKVDHRVHGTTHQTPMALFLDAEAAALRPLHDPRLQVASQRLKRRVANDCYVDVETVRYSVPHRLARESVEVQQTADEVIVWFRREEVARHRKGRAPHQLVTDPAHHRGLFSYIREPVRPTLVDPALQAYQEGLASFERPLASYESLLGGPQ